MPTTTIYSSGSASLARTVAGDFSSLRNGNGSSAAGLSYNPAGQLTSDVITTDQYTELYRAAAKFDTTAIGSDTISSATAGLYIFSTFNKNELLLTDFNLHATGFGSTPGTPFVAGDYQKVANVDFGNAAIPGSDGFCDITLNASGRANINGSGDSYFAFRLGCDVTGTFDGTWVSSKQSRALADGNDGGVPAQYPKLVVTHSAPAPSGGLMLGCSI